MAAAGRRRLRILTALGLATVLLSLPERQVSLRSVPKARHHGTEDCRQLVDQIPEPKDTPERRAQLKEMGFGEVPRGPPSVSDYSSPDPDPNGNPLQHLKDAAKPDTKRLEEESSWTEAERDKLDRLLPINRKGKPAFVENTKTKGESLSARWDVDRLKALGVLFERQKTHDEDDDDEFEYYTTSDEDDQGDEQEEKQQKKAQKSVQKSKPRNQTEGTILEVGLKAKSVPNFTVLSPQNFSREYFKDPTIITRAVIEIPGQSFFLPADAYVNETKANLIEEAFGVRVGSSDNETDRQLAVEQERLGFEAFQRTRFRAAIHHLANAAALSPSNDTYQWHLAVLHHYKDILILCSRRICNSRIYQHLEEISRIYHNVSMPQRYRRIQEYKRNGFFKTSARNWAAMSLHLPYIPNSLNPKDWNFTADQIPPPPDRMDWNFEVNCFGRRVPYAEMGGKDSTAFIRDGTFGPYGSLCLNATGKTNVTTQEILEFWREENNRQRALRRREDWMRWETRRSMKKEPLETVKRAGLLAPAEERIIDDIDVDIDSKAPPESPTAKNYSEARKIWKEMALNDQIFYPMYWEANATMRKNRSKRTVPFVWLPESLTRNTSKVL
ncbi:hypothetical protein AAMO2058_000413800 [Amorphochlora amoebiformis]